MPIFNFLRIPVILFAYVRMVWLSYSLNTREKLERWQKRKIELHLRYIRAHSPYFRKRLAASTLEACRAMPLINKEELMRNFTEINTRGISQEHALRVAIDAERTRDFGATIDGVTVGLSSGTSGHRGIFMASPVEQWMYAGTALFKILPGFWRRKNRVAFFLRANNNLYTAVKSRMLRFEYFDLLEPLEKHVERLGRLQPTLLIAPPSLLRQLAEKSLARELSIAPDKIISVAEVLDPVDESFISGVFGQKVHQVYQATEGFLAATCRAGVLHLNEDILHIEKEWLDREHRKFQPVITDFTRKTQPIVRYRLNDILSERATPCPCGSVHTALEFIEGRSDDLFLLPSGTAGGNAVAVYPDFIRRTMLFASENILDYRVVQSAAAKLQIYYSCQPENEAEIRDSIEREFLELGNRLGFRIEHLEFFQLPKGSAPSGGKKLRRIVNEFKTSGARRSFDTPQSWK